jgi:hypothetical protein
MTHTTALGALGWDWPQWTEAFYPPDLPPEWRLTFYNTQFHCVFLEADAWRQAGVDDYPAWAADTHDQFVFLLEDALPEQLPRALAGKAIGVARNDPGLLWFDRTTSLKGLADRITAQTMPLYLLSQDGDLGQIERVRTLLELLGR